MNNAPLASIPIIASSGGNSSRGDAANFTVRLTAPIVFNPKERWEAVFVNASFPRPVNSGTSVYIYLQEISPSELSGGLFPILKRLPPTSSTADPQFFEELSTVISSKHIDRTVLTELTFSIAESTGVSVPTGADKFSTIEILLKRVA